MVMIFVTVFYYEDPGQDVHERDVCEGAYGHKQYETHPPIERLLTFHIINYWSLLQCEDGEGDEGTNGATKGEGSDIIDLGASLAL